MSKGFVSIHRSICDCWLWDNKPFAYGQAWVDLIILARHEDGKMLHNGKVIPVKRGDINRSISSLATRWGWDRRKVRKFLRCLESDGMVLVNSTTHGTTITLVNYDNFQLSGTTKRTTKCTTDAQPSVQPMPTNNNENNENNENNIERGKKFAPPSLDDVKSYFTEKGVNDPNEADMFFSFYESKGWMVGKNKMKDWQAAVRGWIARNKKPTEKKTAFNTFEGQRDYDFEELEKRLVAN